VAQVVCWLPVIERLVAILDRGKEGGYQIRGEKEVECRDGFNGVGILDGPVGHRDPNKYFVE